MKRPRLVDRRADHQTSKVTIVVAALGAAVVLGTLTYLAAVAPRGVPGYDYYSFNLELEDTADLRVLSAVHIAGRRVGNVGEITHDGAKATLKLQLSPGERFIKSDSTARVRGKNLVGAKYIEITPGPKGKPLKDGDTMPLSQTSTAVDYAELLGTFDSTTRGNIRDTVGGLGTGFIGRGQDINETIITAPPLLRNFRATSDAVLAHEGAAARLAPSLQSLTTAYDPVREELAEGFRTEADALAPFSDRARSVQATLELAPPALTSLREGLSAATPLLGETAGFARAAVRLTDPAPAALRETTVLLRDAQPALTRARPLLGSVHDAIPPTLSLLDRIGPIVRPTRSFLRTQVPTLRELGSRGCDVFTWGRTWRDAMSFGVPPGTDPASDLDNGQGIGLLTSFRVLGVPQDDEESLAADAPNTGTARIGRNPYPEACEAGPERLPEVVP